MSRVRIDWSPEFVRTPVTYWVHGHRVGDDPPCPPVGERGWPRAVVTCRGHELVFATPEEVRHVADVLSRRNLPRPRALAEASVDGDVWGHANSHWLSRLPAELRPWRVREGLVADLRAADAALTEAFGPRSA